MSGPGVKSAAAGGVPPRRRPGRHRFRPRLHAIRHRIEDAAARALWRLCRWLGPDRASALGGWTARSIGPLLPAHRVARANLGAALGPFEPGEERRILRAMWDNLGRVAAEYPHLATIARERVHIRGAEHIEALAQDGRPGFLFSAHFGNWEIAPLLSADHGVSPTVVYRALNNPRLDRMLRRLRKAAGGEFVAKSAQSGRQLLRVLRAGGHVAMLVDQKANDGIAVPFFGRDAMTAPAIAVLALALDCPVVPARVERIRGCRFEAVVEPPLTLARTGDRDADVEASMRAINARIEAWVRARPEQWFWVHRRWPPAENTGADGGIGDRRQG